MIMKQILTNYLSKIRLRRIKGKIIDQAIFIKCNTVENSLIMAFNVEVFNPVQANPVREEVSKIGRASCRERV